MVFTILSLFHLRKLELKNASPDPVWSHKGLETQQPNAVQARENIQRQNHLISLARIKPGKFRLMALKTILRTFNLLARVTKNNSTLGKYCCHSCRSVHCSRKSIPVIPWQLRRWLGQLPW
jgi:hypothetical protein